MLRRCYQGLAAMCLAAGMCLPAFAEDTTAAGARDFTPAQHLMHDILASHFGLTHQQVMDLNARGYSYEDIATAANLAARSGRPLSDVVALRDQKMEWTAIATQIGLTAADVDRPFYRYTGPESITYEYRVYEQYTGIPVADYERYRKMGYSSRDIAMAYNLAQRTGHQPDEVFAMLDRGMTWNAIAGQYNVAMADLEAPHYRVAGARTTLVSESMAGAPTPGPSNYAMPNTNIDWSRTYELTPAEMRRLRAKGLTDKEIYVVANTAILTGRPVDDIVQRIFRGETVDMIAQDLNVRPSVLEDPKPEWTSPAFEQAVREGATLAPTSPTTSRSGERRRGRRGRRGGMEGGGMGGGMGAGTTTTPSSPNPSSPTNP
jgi:uncharacterized protein (DUF433 family)